MTTLSASPWFIFFLAALAVWRVTHFIHAEDGPFDILFYLRKAMGHLFLGTLMDCFYCLSLWISAPVALLLCQDWTLGILMWLGLSAAAIFLEKVHCYLSDKEQPEPAQPQYVEDPVPQQFEEDGDGVLRK